jgi:hypothetical protein
MRFDFTTRKTEAEWGASIYQLVAGLTAAAFTIIEWALVAGAGGYLAHITESKLLSAIATTLQILLALHVQFYLTQKVEIDFFSRDELQRVRWKFWLTVIINIIIISAVFLVLRIMIAELIETATQKGA